MVGQTLVTAVLKQMVDTDTVPSALLFSGMWGSGKTTLARIVASKLTGVSISDIELGRTLNVQEIDAASNGNVADTRQLIENLRYEVDGSSRVLILDEVHSASRESFNTLLKTLEEPPEGVTFILITTEPQKIPDTVKSRLMEFEFHRIAPTAVEDRLRHVASIEGFELDDDLLVAIAERSQGSMRDALVALDQVTLVGIRKTSTYLKLIGETDTAPEIIQHLLDGNAEAVFAAVDRQLSTTGDSSRVSSALVSCFRDITVLKARGSIIHTGEALEVRQDLASRIDSMLIAASLKLLWDLKTRVKSSEDPRNNLDLVLMLLLEVYSRNKPQYEQPVAPKPEPRKMSLAEIE